MNTPKIEQWMRDAEDEFYADLAENGGKVLRKVIAKHAPAQPAELPSIWKPVSQRPTKDDADSNGCVVVRYGESFSGTYSWKSAPIAPGHFWCRTADLLARCPLPKVKTQEDLDAEAFETWWKQNPSEQPSVYLAAAFHAGLRTGRANAEEGK